jgi:hypothetical protein
LAEPDRNLVQRISAAGDPPGNFVSKADLTRKILAYIAYYNECHAHPYR